MSLHPEEEILISLVPLREGVKLERFAEFASSLDLPVWRSKDVVLAFDTYEVAAEDREWLGADFVEVMRVRSLREWEEVGSADLDIQPLAAGFAELVDEARVRRIHVQQIASP